jgi:hypothetical protein
MISMVALAGSMLAQSKEVRFSEPPTSIEAYDFVGLAVQVQSPDAENPFTSASVHGWFEKARGDKHVEVEGFCDSADGTLFRIRFMPSSSGDYKYCYFRYAVARLSTFSNVTWDLWDDMEGYRDDQWTHTMGPLIEDWDPYKHLPTSHPKKTMH